MDQDAVAAFALRSWSTLRVSFTTQAHRATSQIDTLSALEFRRRIEQDVARLAQSHTPTVLFAVSRIAGAQRVTGKMRFRIS